jgi:hypothetical protein
MNGSGGRQDGGVSGCTDPLLRSTDNALIVRPPIWRLLGRLALIAQESGGVAFGAKTNDATVVLVPDVGVCVRVTPYCPALSGAQNSTV